MGGADDAANFESDTEETGRSTRDWKKIKSKKMKNLNFLQDKREETEEKWRQKRVCLLFFEQSTAKRISGFGLERQVTKD